MTYAIINKSQVEIRLSNIDQAKEFLKKNPQDLLLEDIFNLQKHYFKKINLIWNKDKLLSKVFIRV